MGLIYLFTSSKMKNYSRHQRCVWCVCAWCVCVGVCVCVVCECVCVYVCVGVWCVCECGVCVVCGLCVCVWFCYTSLAAIQKYSLLHTSAFVENLFR